MISPDGRLMAASGRNDADVTLWDCGRRNSSGGSRSRPPSGDSWSSGSRTTARPCSARRVDGFVQTWRVADGKEIASYRLKDPPWKEGENSCAERCSWPLTPQPGANASRSSKATSCAAGVDESQPVGRRHEQAAHRTRPADRIGAAQPGRTNRRGARPERVETPRRGDRRHDLERPGQAERRPRRLARLPPDRRAQDKETITVWEPARAKSSRRSAPARWEDTS